MKKIMLIVLIAFSMSAYTQEPVTQSFFVDTIVSKCGVEYTNTYDDIWLYHESDYTLYETPADAQGDWVWIFYDNTTFPYTVYVYFMTEELCYRMITYTDPETISYADNILKLWGQ